MKYNYEALGQYDYYDDEYLDKVIEKYSALIGLFIIKYSSLEHEIDIAIAEFLGDDFHETGYVIIEKLTISNKIDLFYKMHSRLESFKEKKNKMLLDDIKKRLLALNTFRNNIAHANWETLTKEGYVRVRIVVDNDEGFVKLKKVQITPKILRDSIKDINRIENSIFKYREKAFI
jgi:hypothetical protein